MEKKQLIDFVLKNDFAFVFGAGIMYANDQETREWVSSLIEEDGNIIEESNSKECPDLINEYGCTIYKVYNFNKEALYIAYYE